METVELLTPKEVQRMLKCSLPWVYKAARLRILPSVPLPMCPGNGKRQKKMVRFKPEDILDLIEKHYRSVT